MPLGMDPEAIERALAQKPLKNPNLIVRKDTEPMTDPVQSTEAVEALASALRDLGIRYGRIPEDRISTASWYLLDAVLPLLRREVAAEIRSDEMVEVVARFLWPDWVDDAAAKKLAKAKNIADAVATRIEGAK